MRRPSEIDFWKVKSAYLRILAECEVFQDHDDSLGKTVEVVIVPIYVQNGKSQCERTLVLGMV